MHEVGIVHLVWTPLGPEPLQRFLASYTAHPGAHPHELIVVFNGFDRPEELRPFEALLRDVPHSPLRLEKPGQDLVSYYEAAWAHPLPYLCFLNSYTQLLDAEWLQKMMRHIKRDGVGIVGASSSYLSYRKYYAEQQAMFYKLPPYDTLMGHARYQLVRLAYHFWYPSYPNPFIRTNGFLVARDVWNRLDYPRMTRKTDAFRLEQGVHSITRQIQNMGLRPIVVGRDGEGYETADWPRSLTFMQGNQENLLMADNQTSFYQAADDAQRQELSYNSWAGDAAPAVGAQARRVWEVADEAQQTVVLSEKHRKLSKQAV